MGSCIEVGALAPEKTYREPKNAGVASLTDEQLCLWLIMANYGISGDNLRWPSDDIFA